MNQQELHDTVLSAEEEAIFLTDSLDARIDSPAAKSAKSWDEYVC